MSGIQSRILRTNEGNYTISIENGKWFTSYENKRYKILGSIDPDKEGIKVRGTTYIKKRTGESINLRDIVQKTEIGNQLVAENIEKNSLGEVILLPGRILPNKPKPQQNEAP